MFAIVYEAKTGKLHGLNASGWAPAGLTLDFLKGRGFSEMPQLGVYSVTVPGCVDVGTNCSAVRAAEDERCPRAVHSLCRGRFSGHGNLCQLLGGQRTEAAAGSEFGQRLPAEWRAPRTGEIFRNPDLACLTNKSRNRGAKRFTRARSPSAF